MQLPKLKRKHIVILVATLLVVGLGLFWAHREGFTLEWLHGKIEDLPIPLLLVVMAILPIFGFSIGLVYLVAGSKFGGALGMLVVTVSIAIHLLGSWWVANSFLKARVERYLKKSKHKLPHVPKGENLSLTIMTALVPGIPYALRNYLLALSGVDFKTYFWVCLPIYALRASIGIFLGHLSKDFSLKSGLILGGILVVKISICWYLFRRIKRKAAQEDLPAKTQLNPV